MKTQSVRRKQWMFLIFAAASGVLGFLFGKFGLQHSGKLPDIVVIANVILFLPAFFIVVGLHELGHAAAGIWMKFDFKMYVIGPFMWEKEIDGWTFKWNKNVNTAGGLVVCIPISSENLKSRFSIYAAAGPIASLLWAGTSYLIYQFFEMINPNAITSLQVFTYFFIINSFLSFAIFIVTSLPFHMGGFSSDGARVLRLQRGDDVSKFEILILKIITSSAGGVRPSLLGIDELKEASVLAKKFNSPFQVYLDSYFHQAAFDRGDIEEAEIHLKNYIKYAADIPEGPRGAVWLDAALFYAYAKKDLEQAHVFWGQFKPSAIIPKAQILATEAAMALLKNEREKALSKIESSLQQLPNMIDRGIGVALKDKLIIMKDSTMLRME